MGISTRTVAFGTIVVLSVVVAAMFARQIVPEAGEVLQWALLWALCWLVSFGLMHTARTYNSPVLTLGGWGLALLSIVPFVYLMGSMLK